MAADKTSFQLNDAIQTRWYNILCRIVSTPRTRKDCKRRLLERGCPTEIAEQLISNFCEDGLIDDLAYSTLYIDSHPDWGALRVWDELCVRGVEADLIRQALKASQTDERSKAVELAKAWHSAGIDDGKIYNRLLRRGFRTFDCKGALSSLNNPVKSDTDL